MLCPTCSTPNLEGASACSACATPLGASASAGRRALHASQLLAATAGKNGDCPHALPAGILLQGGAYEIERVLEEDGRRITYAGRDRRLERPTCVKEFFPTGAARGMDGAVHPTRGLSPDEYRGARAHCLEEARLLARFHHPGIIQVLDAFEENETAYVVTEPLLGNTLGRIVEEQGPLEEAAAIACIARVAEAVTVIHQAGFIHCGISPYDVVATQEGRMVLTEFGNACEFALAGKGRIVPTLIPGYSPPEQYEQPARLGPFTDIYALGATLYYLLTAEMPAQGPDRAGGLALPPPNCFRSGLSPRTNDAVMRAMEMGENKRPRTVQEFFRMLHVPRHQP